MKYLQTTLFIYSLSLVSDPIDKIIHIVPAIDETPQVISKGDAADDPAIWLNKLNPDRSLVFGTDKRSGIYTYNLKAEKIGYTEIGDINNIDVRTMNITDDDNKDIGSYSFIFASNRTTNTLDIWAYKDTNIDKAVKDNNFEISKEPYINAKANMVVYGVCAGIDSRFGLIAFLTEDEGSKVQMWNYGPFGMTLLTTFNNGNATQSEGCVYDDENRTLFISEEQDRGILRAYKINNELDFSNPIIIDNRSGNIDDDPEGVTVYKSSEKDGYVIVSSQGDSSFNIYNRQEPYNYLGSFKVGSNKGIDNVNDTDGIDVINFNLGYKYPMGLFVVQDGTNDGKNKVKRQNFKYVSFADVLKKLDL